MLVIISDLHLTDGTSGEIINDTAFRLLKNRLSDMAYDASWRCNQENCINCRDGSNCQKYYEPIDKIDIILLGDILDMIRSEKWNSAFETIMPWTKPRENEFFQLVEQIVDGILEFNKSSFDILKGIANKDITIPKDMKLAAVDVQHKEKITYQASEEKAPVEVNIYYMIGNHDWFFYINDDRLNKIRNKVIDALGLANEKDKTFPYDRKDCKQIEIIQQAHRVFAEHGDKFDKTNFQTPHRDASSVGDVVVIKLLNEIPAKINEYLQITKEKAGTDEEIAAFIKQLREIDNLRPYTLAPAWISQALKESKLKPRVVNKAIRNALKAVVKEFVKNNIICKDSKLLFHFKILKFFLAFGFDINMLSNIINHTSIYKDRPESYRKYAISLAHAHQEDFFVMGHTHYAELVPLSNYVDHQKIKRTKIYLNTGTWREVHLRGIDDHSFISFKSMTIASFFKPEERKGKAFEFWQGSLSL